MSEQNIKDNCLQPTLAPCVCPQVTPTLSFDASSPIRFISFKVTVHNLCRNRPFLLAVVICDGKNVVGEVFRKIQPSTQSPNSCQTLDVNFENVLINESLCSNTPLNFLVFGNYGAICDANCCRK